MDAKKRRSVLRKSCSGDATPRLLRRISFSGKHLVREFQSEEEPQTWNNSYEISDHIHVDETVSKLCVPKSKSKAIQKSHEDKENVSQEVSQDISQSRTNASVTNNNSGLSSTKEFINKTYRGNIYVNPNSVDVTLFQVEVKFPVGTNSFSETEHEKELTSILGERTIDFMQNDSKKSLKNESLNKRDASGVTVYSEYMDEVQYMDITCAEDKRTNEPVTMSESEIRNENPNIDTKKATNNRKTNQQTVSMEFSPTKANQYDKDNAVSISNATINKRSHMEIDAKFGQPLKAYVEKESQQFHEKLNKLSFLQESDDNMQMDITPMREVNRGAIPKVKYRPTINLIQPIEVSPVKVKNNSLRQTVNFNEDIGEVSPVKDTKISSRQTAIFNEDIRDESQVKVKSNQMRQTVNFNEDIRTSPVKSSQDDQTIRKTGQPSKYVVRKICTSLLSKCQNQVELEQQRMLRVKKKVEQEALPATVSDKVDEVALDKAPIAETSFNMSRIRSKNVSLSSDLSSPLIPSEFNVYNLKQLNDEFERGKIHVYSNAKKTPTTDRKTKAASHFSKKLQCSETSKQRRTLIFKDADIPVASATDDSLTNAFKSIKSKDYFDLNTTQDSEKKNNAKCRYSQADDMMLDNTSFLTRAKLGDETASRNSSKRDMTQTNNIRVLYEDTLEEAASQLGGNLNVKSSKGNNAGDTLSQMFQNAKPICRQTITNIRDDDFMDLYDNENLLNTQNDKDTHEYKSNKNDIKRNTLHLNDDNTKPQYNETQIQLEADLNGKKHDNIIEKPQKRTTMHQNDMDIEDEIIRKNGNKEIRYENNDMEIDLEDGQQDIAKAFNEENRARERVIRKTLYFNNAIEEVEEPEKFYYNPQQQKQKHLRHTMHFDNENIENNEPHQIEDTASTEYIEKQNRETLNISEDIECASRHDYNLHRPVSMLFENRNADILETVAENSKNLRKTMHFHNDNIDVETPQDLPKDRLTRHTLYLNKDIEKLETQELNCGNTGLEKHSKTIFYTNENTIEDGMDVVDKQNEAQYNTEPEQLKQHHLRHTILIDNEEPHEVDNNCNHTISMHQLGKSNRHTLYLNDDIEHKKNSESSFQHVETKNTDIKGPSAEYSKSSRKTINSNNNDIDAKEISSLAQMVHSSAMCAENVETDDKVDKRRQTLHFHKDIDLNESNLNSKEACTNMSLSALHANSDYMELEEVDNQKTCDKLSQARKSIYSAQCMDLTLDAIPTTKENVANVEHKNRQTIHFHSEILNEDVAREGDNQLNLNYQTEVPQSSIMKNNANLENDVSVEKSPCTPAEKYCYPESTKLNAAKMSLFRQRPSLARKLKNVVERTPVKNGSAWPSICSAMTPVSLEFFALEKKFNEEYNSECGTYTTSPVRDDVSKKRLPLNLTPVASLPKKRQALEFGVCHMDETIQTQTSDNNNTKEINNIQFINDDVKLTTPRRSSRIPIPLSSGKKLAKSISLANTSPPSNDSVEESIRGTEFDEELEVEMDEENCTGSIQMLRRATKYTQRIVTNIDPAHQPIEFKQAEVQPSLFEENPITISDVSVFFTAQRKNNNENTSVPVPDLTLAMNAINISALERSKAKSIQNACINLTRDSLLDDIDQTRLSLVKTLSEDDDDDEDYNVNQIVVEYNDVRHEQPPPVTEKATSECNKNVTDLKFKRRSVNNLSAAVCRKCKRCQDTMLSETSSTDDTFVLPALLPFPDLGLDRLRRLRKRPTIADVNVLWQRVSLDRTIMNPITISDDDDDDDDYHILSDTEVHNVKIESNPGIKALRKYQKEMQEFEMDLLESLQEKKASFVRRRPFIARLEDLLSSNSSNWIFDYQMQLRGIYLFSHRKMLTFSVSLTFAEVDPLGIDLNFKAVKLQKSHVPLKNWKPIDFILEFQLMLSLPYDLQSLCEGSNNEVGIFKMLQTIDRAFVETVKMVNALQRVVFSNQASIIRDQCGRTYVRKIIRRIVKGTDNDNGYPRVEKMKIKVEILHLKKLSFKDIVEPRLHNFCEEIHLLPVGLQFLHEFLPNPLSFLKNP